MIKIGITGGIGSGKSIIGQLLQTLTIPVYIADTESKQLLNTSSSIRTKLSELFGSDIYTETGVDKRKLASYIFNSPELLQKVNGIIHPEVGHHFLQWCAAQDSYICAIESAILFESGFDSYVDKTLTVYAPESERISRVKQRDNMSEELIKQRIRNQLSDEIKKERADFIIYNDGKTAIIPQVHSLIRSL